MRRIIVPVLILILCFSLYACASEPLEKPKSRSDLAAEAVELHVRTHIHFKYNIDSATMCTTRSVREVSSNVFEVHGTASVSCSGNRFNLAYVGTATYDPALDKFFVDFDVMD